MDSGAEEAFRAARKKGRSASICAPSSSSMEAVLTSAAAGSSSSTAATPTDPGTPGTPSTSRRRRPATRSHSARISGNKSVRRPRQQDQPAIGTMRSGTSEPRLNHHGDGFGGPRIGDVVGASGSNTPESSPGGRRRPTGGRRATSMHHAHTGTVHRDHHQQRKSTAFLDVPDVRGARQPDEDEDSYRLRSFSATSKGVVNRGDSFRRRRSRSNSLLPSEGFSMDRGGTTPLLRSPAAPMSPAAPYAIAMPGMDVVTHRVAMLGAPGVGKSALISQFMTSECINAYDGMRDVPKEQSVSIMLNGEESELQFVNYGTLKELEAGQPCAALVMMFSVVDKSSFQKTEMDLQRLQELGMLRNRAVILVANKVDLARSRAVSTQDGKCLACTYKAKFIEVSVGINHNVDELLVGILTQIRIKATQTERESTAHWYKNRGMVRASMKARQMFTWIFGREDSKFKNCENLNVA
ncbi:GTP-binding protein REM 1 [Thrips palmi]|uniref:GTP-binding protein REM 1 n=1 Tax=Thrips palmi TaxID=161013 RepID=A0A6P9A0B5_THRPL|nr:GTP-binding protein REM 1 [Thrips palmi]